MASRLGGQCVEIPNHADPTQIHLHKFADMAAAVSTYRHRFTYPGKSIAKRSVLLAVVPSAMMDGTPAELPAILERSEELAAAAVAIDPRLGARPGWVRGIEGVDLCPALLAAGEEACCFDRKRQRRSDATAAGEPVRIVISSDTKDVAPDAAAAFIAAAKLAAQFVPLEIWWQSSFLRERDQPAAGFGHVSLVPLLRAGEMDFSRLQFVLCHQARDHAGYSLMFDSVYQTGIGFGAGLLERSMLEGTADFIPASGIHGDAAEVAERAARWAGFESAWSAEWNATRSREQNWSAPSAPYVETVETEADRTARERHEAANRKRWAKEDEERERADRARTDKRRGELF